MTFIFSFLLCGLGVVSLIRLILQDWSYQTVSLGWLMGTVGILLVWVFFCHQPFYVESLAMLMGLFMLCHGGIFLWKRQPTLGAGDYFLLASLGGMIEMMMVPVFLIVTGVSSLGFSFLREKSPRQLQGEDVFMPLMPGMIFGWLVYLVCSFYIIFLGSEKI